MAYTCSRTPTPIPRTRSRNTCTRCGSPRASCGGSKPRSAMPCISTCGTTTLSAPNSILEPERLQALPRLPRAEREPVLAEPSQAQAFALAVKLSEQGNFTWKEWATALANELKADATRGEPDDGSRYYDHWLVALKRLVTPKGLAHPASLLRPTEALAQSYRPAPP